MRLRPHYSDECIISKNVWTKTKSKMSSKIIISYTCRPDIFFHTLKVCGSQKYNIHKNYFYLSRFPPVICYKYIIKVLPFRNGHTNRNSEAQSLMIPQGKMPTGIFFIIPIILGENFCSWKEIWQNYIYSTYILFFIYIYTI